MNNYEILGESHLRGLHYRTMCLDIWVPTLKWNLRIVMGEHENINHFSLNKIEHNSKCSYVSVEGFT